jgi:hypothetical protein
MPVKTANIADITIGLLYEPAVIDTISLLGCHCWVMLSPGNGIAPSRDNLTLKYFISQPLFLFARQY